jgi:hypothetical protein
MFEYWRSKRADSRQPQQDNPPEPQLDSAAEALMRAIEQQRETDPLIGAKVGGKELFQRLVQSMKDERGVHLESLLCALGALAGYSCQASLRALALAKGLPETTGLTILSGANGESYFFGDLLNQPLAEAQYSVWGACGRGGTAQWMQHIARHQQHLLPCSRDGRN